MRNNVKWTVYEQASFLKRTGELLLRGYPLADALASLSLHLENNKQIQLRTCLENLKEGDPFYRILTDLQFNKNLVNYVYFAEQHGGLAEAIIEGSTMMLKRENDYQRLKKLVTYPIFLALLTLILFYFVNRVLLPKFTVLYADMNVQSTIFSNIILAFGSVIPLIFYLFLMLASLAFVTYFFKLRKYSIIEQRIMLARIPLIGNYLKLVYSQNFSIQLSYLFSSGMSVIDALNVFEKNKQEAFSVEIGKEIKQHLATGIELDCAVAMFPFFEVELCRIIKHGQENGKLDQELYFYSRYCLSQLEESTEKTLKIVQPVLYSVIGLLIVSLYLAILFPMFELIQEI